MLPKPIIKLDDSNSNIKNIGYDVREYVGPRLTTAIHTNRIFKYLQCLIIFLIMLNAIYPKII